MPHLSEARGLKLCKLKILKVFVLFLIIKSQIQICQTEQRFGHRTDHFAQWRTRAKQKLSCTTRNQMEDTDGLYVVELSSLILWCLGSTIPLVLCTLICWMIYSLERCKLVSDYGASCREIQSMNLKIIDHPETKSFSVNYLLRICAVC